MGKGAEAAGSHEREHGSVRVPSWAGRVASRPIPNCLVRRARAPARPPNPVCVRVWLCALPTAHHHAGYA